MPEQKVLVGEDTGKRRSRALPPDTEAAWKWVGWLGAVLAVVGLADFLLAWYPLNLGSPEWEFATVAQTFSGLPLVSIGLAGLLGAGLALGKRWLIIGTGLLLVAGAAVLLLALALFLLDVPLALSASEGLARTGIKKAVIKTLMLGVVFGGAYLVAGIAAFRHLKNTTEG
jgi:hypothetical protein